MQAKNALITVLVLLAAGLGIGLITLNKKTKETKQQDVARITTLSNDVVTTLRKLEDQQQVNLTLETNVALLKNDLSGLKTRLNSTESNLANTAAALTKAQTDAKAAAEAAAAEMAKRDARIQQLEGQNDELTTKMVDLNTALGNLEKQIATTEQKLAASEGDREFLLKELKRLQAEKAELERQFNDLAVLREQVRKLKEELSIARRLEWIRRGIYASQTQKGAEALIRPAPPAAAKTSDLNVELHQDGTTKVVAPTNAPANVPAPK